MGRFSKLETGASASPDAKALPDVQTSDALPKARQKTDSAPAKAEPEYDFAHYFGEADRLYYSGEYQKALRLYSRAIQADHSSVQPWVGQVLCLIELRQFREAMTWVKRGLELFPEEARLVSLHGAVYALQGMTQRGLGCSDYAIQLSGADPLVWIIRGEILSLAENKNSAHCFEKAMETRQPDDWQTPMQIGLRFLNQKKWAKAAEYLNAAAHINLHNPFLWMKLGLANERLGLTQAALDAFNAARQLDPLNNEIDGELRKLTGKSLPSRLFRRIFR